MNNYIQKIKIWFQKFRKDPLCLRRWEFSYGGLEYKRDNRLSVKLMGKGLKKRYPYAGDSSMFIEDMYIGIMPLKYQSGNRQKYPVRIIPHSEEKERFIADNLGGRNYRTFLSDALFDFVRNTAHVLFSEGVAFYEIIYKKDESGKIDSFSLDWVTPYYLFKCFGSYYQIIPWWEAKASNTRVQIIKIPQNKIVRIDFPKELGGRKKIRKILKRLWCLGKEIIPQFQIDAMGGKKDIGFNLEKFQRGKYLEIAKLTKKIGWNSRTLTTNNITEYYSLTRFLRQKKAEALLRSHIITKLNEVLNGSILNLEVEIVAENIFTVEDVEKQEKVLGAGKVTFMDIFNATNL